MATLLVPHEPASAARVRQALFDDLVAHHVEADSVDSVVLITSELLGNAIRHTSWENVGLRVSWEFEATTVRVDVADHSTGTPLIQMPNPSEPGGRGLTIVDALSHEWGFDRTDSGKRVWARVPVDVAAAV